METHRFDAGVASSFPPKGFTLIELLMVIAVIGILAVLSSYRYVEAVNRADTAVCQDNLRILYTALLAYRNDYNRFPSADGLADTRSRPETTNYGCGPAANGYWSGVPLLLVQGGYCPESALFCPSLKRAHNQPTDAYSTCGDSELSGRQVPQWRFLRYAYNYAALDAGGNLGGEQNIELVQTPETWLVRCLHLEVGRFDPARAVPFPNRIETDETAAGEHWLGEFELTVTGVIRERVVQRVKN